MFFNLKLLIIIKLLFWVGTEKHPLGREEGERGVMGSRKNANSRNSSLQLLIQKFQTKNQPQKTDISKQHSKQARTEMRNYEMFANPVFINLSVNKL